GVLGVEAISAKSSVELVEAYVAKDSASICQLYQELYVRNELLHGVHGMTALTTIAEHWIGEIKKYYDECAKNPEDKEAQIKAKQLKEVFLATKRLVQTEVATWLQPGKAEQLYNSEVERTRASKELFIKVANLAQEYAAKPEIAKHRNRIGARLKQIAAIFI